MNECFGGAGGRFSADAGLDDHDASSLEPSFAGREPGALGANDSLQQVHETAGLDTQCEDDAHVTDFARALGRFVGRGGLSLAGRLGRGLHGGGAHLLLCLPENPVSKKRLPHRRYCSRWRGAPHALNRGISPRLCRGIFNAGRSTRRARLRQRGRR